MDYKNLGPAAVMAAAFLRSLDGLLRRHLYALPPTVIVFWEHALGFIVLIPVVARSWRTFFKLTGRQWAAIVGVSFLSGALGTTLYTSALAQIQYIPFSVVVLLQQLQPLFAIGAAVMLLREPLTPRFCLLTVLTLVSAYFVSFPNLSVNFSTGSGTAVAALMAIGAAIAWGTSTAFSKYALVGMPVQHVTFLRFGFSAIFALIITIMLGKIALLGALTSIEWQYIIFITFSTGLVALMLYYFGLKRVSASLASLLELVWPLSAVVIGYFFMDETLSVTQWAGAIVLTTTIYMLVHSHRHPAKSA